MFKIKQKPKFKELPDEVIEIRVMDYYGSGGIDLNRIVKEMLDRLHGQNAYHVNIAVPDTIDVYKLQFEATTDDYDYGAHPSPYLKVTYQVRPSDRVCNDHLLAYEKKLKEFEKWEVDNKDKIAAELVRRAEQEKLDKIRAKDRTQANLNEERARLQKRLAEIDKKL